MKMVEMPESQSVDQDPKELQEGAAIKSPWNNYIKENWTIFRRNPFGMVGMVLLLSFALMAILSFVPPMIDPMYHPMNGVDPDIETSVGPSARHWLGTDFMGRDILSQLLTGARVAFMIGISAAFMSVVIGTFIGMISGYFGRWVDNFLMRFADIIMILPGLLVILILSSIVGQLSIWNLVIIIAFFKWAGVSRVIRAQTMSIRVRPYIEAAMVAGASHLRILLRHILPNVLPLSLLYMTFGVTSAILIEAALSFLGFGDPGTVSWGMMLQWVWRTGNMFKAPYWLLPPGICISLITLSFYLIGRALDEVLNPRLRKEVLEQ
jgi:peptide/nickel transport system permease protein